MEDFVFIYYSILCLQFAKIVGHRYIISSQIKIISYFKWDILMNISTNIFLRRLLADLLIYYLLRGNLEIMKSFICRNQKFDKAVTIHFANDLANKTSHEYLESPPLSFKSLAFTLLLLNTNKSYLMF